MITAVFRVTLHFSFRPAFGIILPVWNVLNQTICTLVGQQKAKSLEGDQGYEGYRG